MYNISPAQCGQVFRDLPDECAAYSPDGRAPIVGRPQVARKQGVVRRCRFPELPLISQNGEEIAGVHSVGAKLPLRLRSKLLVLAVALINSIERPSRFDESRIRGSRDASAFQDRYQRGIGAKLLENVGDFRNRIRPNPDAILQVTEGFSPEPSQKFGSNINVPGLNWQIEDDLTPPTIPLPIPHGFRIAGNPGLGIRRIC